MMHRLPTALLLATALALPTLSARAQIGSPPSTRDSIGLGTGSTPQFQAGTLAGSDAAATPTANATASYLDLTNTNLTGGTGAQIQFGIIAGNPYATFGTALTDGSNNGAGDLVWGSRNGSAGSVIERLRLSGGNLLGAGKLGFPGGGYFGMASGFGSTWLDTYFSSIENVASILSISPVGQVAGTFASRTSDNAGGSGAAVIPLECVVVSDSTTSHPTWCQYNESDLVGTAVGQHLQTESSVYSTWPVVTGDPYTDNPSGANFNLRLDAGKGSGSPNNITAALDIVNNGAAYRHGIIIGSTALDTAAGRIAPALAMAKNHSLSWYSSAGNEAWKLYSTATSGNGTAVFSNNTFTLNAGAGATTLAIQSGAAGQQAVTTYADSGTQKWQWGKQTDNSLIGYDFANNKTFFAVTAATPGVTSIGETGSSSNTLVGTTWQTATLNATTAINDNGTAPTGTAGSGYVRATGGTLTDPIIQEFEVSTATLTKTTDTTLATVTGLSQALTAGKTYNCHGHLTGTAGASGGITVALVATASLSATQTTWTGFTWNGTTAVSHTTVTALGSNIAAATAVYSDIDIDGSIVVNAGGTINVQAAQNASNATATTVLQGSTFSCVRVN
jgi:hypothetical protein